MERFTLPKLTRALSLERVKDENDDRTLEFPFSSELAVERYFGNEILSHERGAADLGRLNDGAPLLFNHNMDDIVGVVEKAWMGEDKRGYARVRLAKTERAEEIKALIEDGILRNVSFGYRIAEMMDDRKGNYTATAWEPYEISLVTVPADPGVGLGRADEAEQREVVITREAEESAQPAEEVTQPTEVTMTQDATPAVEAVDVEVVRSQAVEAERARIAAIQSLGQKFGNEDLARSLIDGAKSIDEARAAFLEKIEMTQKPVAAPSADVGLTDKEVRSFSFLRAINALANPSDKGAWEAAAFEREVSEAAAAKAGKSSRGIFVPAEVLRRDLTAGTASAGGNLVATDLLAGSFIELLRNQSVAIRAGARTLNGLVGNIAIPRQSGSATAYWVAESGAPTESQQTVDQVTMTPKTVGAYTDFSRRLMLQSSIDVENMVRADLAAVIALAIDKAALYGTGANNQPKGLKLQTGINTKDFAAATPTFAELVAMESEVAADNADVGTMRYLVNAAIRGALKSAEKFSGTGMTVWEPGNTVNGYGTEVSNQIESGDVFFGNFADLLIGFWSGLDLMVDPYAGATSGTMRVIALQDVDVAIRHPESFCYGNATLA